MNAPKPSQTRWRRLALLAALLFPIALHFGDATARLLLRDVELAIDTSPDHPGPIAWISEDGGTRVTFFTNDRGHMEGVVPRTPERWYTRIEFAWDAENRRVSEVSMDGQPLDPDRVVTVRDLYPTSEEFDFVVVRLPRADGRRPLAIAGLTAFLWLGLLALFHPVFERRRTLALGALSIFTYSNAWTRHVKRRDVAIGFAVAAATFFSMVGVDAAPIYGIFRVSSAGLDAYQYQVCFHAVWHNDFPTFMYHPLLLEFWTFFDRAWGALFAHTELIKGQPFAQVFLFKLVNIALLQLTVLSILSFAEEEKLITSRGRLSFYLALFNPVLFYVAILFVQFDTVPLYFVTLGVLLSHRFERHGLIGPLFIALGCSMKAQNILLLPTAGVALVYNSLSADGPLKARLRTAALALVTLGTTLYVFRVLPSRLGTPLQLIFHAANQMARVYNGYPYAAPIVNVYFVFAALTLIFLFYAFSLRLKLPSRDVIVGSILTSGAAIMVFNASHLFTPSTLIQIGASITFVVLMERDPLRRVILSLATVLLVVSTATATYGDIGRIMPGVDPGYFTRLDKTLLDEEKLLEKVPPFEKVHTQFVSVMFTVSIAAMVAYAVLFWRSARKVLAVLDQSSADGDSTSSAARK